MRLLNKLAYSDKHPSGIRKFPIQPILFPVIFGLLIAIFIALSGCGSEAPTSILPTHNISTPAAIVPTIEATPSTTMAQSPLKPPTVLLRMMPSLSTNGLILDIQSVIRNPNQEKLELGNIKVSTRDAEGSIYTQDTFPGGFVEAASSTTFRFNIELPIDLLSFRTLTLEIDTQTVNTATTFSVKSTLPISIPEILDKSIIYPKIYLQTGISKISQYQRQNWVEAQVEGSINNPNPLDLNFMMLGLSIKDKNAAVIQNANIEGNSIPANSNFPFKSTLLLPAEVLNQTGFTANAYASVQFNNNIKTIYNTTAFSIPKLASLISIPQMTFIVNSEWNNNGPRSYIMTVIANLQNDNAFSLATEDFQLKLYNNSSNSLIKSATSSSQSIGEIPGSSTKSVINTRLTFLQTDLPYLGFDAAITGDIKIGIEGVKEKIPVSGRIIYKLPPTWRSY